MRTPRSRSGGLSVVTVSGVIDDNDADELRTQFLEALENAGGDIVMMPDMSIRSATRPSSP